MYNWNVIFSTSQALLLMLEVSVEYIRRQDNLQSHINENSLIKYICSSVESNHREAGRDVAHSVLLLVAFGDILLIGK